MNPHLAGLYEVGKGGWVVNNSIAICSGLAQQTNEHTLVALVCALSSCLIVCTPLATVMASDTPTKTIDAFVVINQL